ncbi:hypothetical protein ACFWUQ_30865 [Streptomyces sp. NPDC058662]|uniref:hypothetical protein n=1 Tax=Streptomyces sp. NPDC058662 TaxID=3346583 RepID=UPI003653EA0A
MLTDREERALLTATENRIAEPLRIGAALASLRRALTSGRRTAARAQERESALCQSTPKRGAPNRAAPIRH